MCSFSSSANLVPIRRKRNSSPATTESPYFTTPSDCCPAGHHQGNMMNPSHDAMMGGGMMHHPMMQQHPQQQQQHFSPGGGNTNRCCAGCGSKIMDRFLLHALDRYWHNACLKCSCCQATLADIGSSCFTKAGMILCKHDYIKWVNLFNLITFYPMMQKLRNNGMVSQPRSQGIKQHWKKWGSFDFKLEKNQKSTIKTWKFQYDF